MEGKRQTFAVSLGILLIVCIAGGLVFYFIRYKPLSEQSFALQRQVTQLQAEIAALNTQLQQTESQEIPRAAGSENVQTLGEIYFYSGYSYLTPGAKQRLDTYIDRLKNSPEATVQVVGHSDTVPIGRRLKEKYPSNWELSVERAMIAAQYLLDKTGIDLTRFVIIGISHEQPQASNESKEGRAQNRRAEIKIVQ